MKKKNADIIAQYVTENQASFYRIAYSYTRNNDNALDVIQDAVYKALNACHTLREPHYIKTWFHRILINASLDYLRKNQKYQLTDQNQQLDSLSVDSYENLDLKKALLTLSDEQRMVIILRYFEDMKLQEIADILDENVNTIKTRLYTALKKLRLEIEDEEVLHHE